MFRRKKLEINVQYTDNNRRKTKVVVADRVPGKVNRFRVHLGWREFIEVTIKETK